jgi:hypothetical protein
VRLKEFKVHLPEGSELERKLSAASPAVREQMFAVGLTHMNNSTALHSCVHSITSAALELRTSGFLFESSVSEQYSNPTQTAVATINAARTRLRTSAQRLEALVSDLKTICMLK